MKVDPRHVLAALMATATVVVAGGTWVAVNNGALRDQDTTLVVDDPDGAVRFQWVATTSLRRSTGEWQQEVVSYAISLFPQKHEASGYQESKVDVMDCADSGQPEGCAGLVLYVSLHRGDGFTAVQREYHGSVFVAATNVKHVVEWTAPARPATYEATLQVFKADWKDGAWGNTWRTVPGGNTVSESFEIQE